MKHWPLDTKISPKISQWSKGQQTGPLSRCDADLILAKTNKQNKKKSLNKISHSKREMEQMNFKNGFGIFITIFVSFLFYDIYNT